MKKLAVLTMIAVGLMLYAGSAISYENANGIGYFALEVPDPGSMVVDGRDNDWGWFDADYIVGPDQMACTLTQVVPPKSDIDIAIMAGWTAEPDNRLYVFVRVTDDTLNVDEAAMDNGWKDDDMEIILDADHDGGWHEAADALRTGHQQWTFHVPTPGAYPQVAYLRWNQPPEMQWAIAEGLVEAAVDVQPEQVHMATDVTVGYEVRMPAWNFLSPDGADASVRHVFVAGQTIGMGVTLNEADTGGRTNQISTHVVEGGAHDADFSSEFFLLAKGEYVSATAVRPSSWGAIKTLLR